MKSRRMKGNQEESVNHVLLSMVKMILDEEEKYINSCDFSTRKCLNFLPCTLSPQKVGLTVSTKL